MEQILDLGKEESSFEDQQNGAKSLHERFFFSSPLQINSAYLVKSEGPAIAAGITQEEEKFMLLFSSESGAAKYLGSAHRSEAIAQMRELIQTHTDRFKTGEPSAFDFHSGVAKLGRSLQADGLVCCLRDLYHFLCSSFDPPQYRLWYQATREVTADYDRLKVRSTFRGDIDLIKALIQDVGLDKHSQRDDIESAIYKWVQSWAKLPVLPRVSDDFSFLAFFCDALVELPDLDASDFRALLVRLYDAEVDRCAGAVDESRFDLFRALARSSRRIPFCQYLLKRHGRNLDLLGERLKAWLVIHVLVNDAPEYFRLFRRSLRLDQFAADLELDHDELRSFTESIVQKARPYRERYELDWLTAAAERLATIIEANRNTGRLELDQSAAVDSLAVQLAGESHRRMSRGEMKGLLVHVARLLQQSVVVAQSTKEACEVFLEYFSPLIGLPQAGVAFRNSSRLSLALADASAELWRSGSNMFRDLAQQLSQLRLPSTNPPELPGKRIAALKTQELVVFSEASLAFDCPSLAGGGLDIGAFLRRESAHGRLQGPQIEAWLKEKDNAAWTRHLSNESIQPLLSQLKQASDSLRIIEKSDSHSQLAGGALEPFTAEIAELGKYFYLFAGEGISRVDEEFQVWIAPKVRVLVDQMDETQRAAWSSVQADLLGAMPERVRPRLESLIYRTTGIRVRHRETIERSGLFSNFRFSGLTRSETDAGVSDTYRKFVLAMLQRLPDHRSGGWFSELVENLIELGDEEQAWFATRKTLVSQLRSQGYLAFSREVDLIINQLAAEFEGVEASFWIEVLAEGRAYLQFLTIGISMTERHDRIAKDSLNAMHSLQSLEGSEYPGVDELSRMVRGFGEILLEQQPSLISFDQVRFWLQEVLPRHEHSRAFWRLLFIHLRNACAAGIPDEMVVTLGSWANRMATSVETLNEFRKTAKEVFHPEKRAFAESRDDESNWKNAFSGLMTVCAAEESGRLPRAILAQHWYDTNPLIQQLTRDQWERVSDAFEGKLKEESDPWLMAAFFSVSKYIGTLLGDRIPTGRELTADENAFVKRSQSTHARARWQNYVAIMSATGEEGQTTFTNVAKLTGWPILPEGEHRLRDRKRKAVLRKAATFTPESLKFGFLRRRPPAIATQDTDTWRARTIGMVIGALNGDLCCQVQCMFSLKMGPMNAWDFKSLQAFAAEVLNFEGGDGKHEQVVTAGWFAATLCRRGDALAEMVVKRWSPYSQDESEKGLHARCHRDLGHLLSHMVHQAVGLSGLLSIDQWYERHVLEFIGDKAFEPFSELVDALRVVLKKELPPPVFDLAQEHLEPLDTLLKKSR